MTDVLLRPGDPDGTDLAAGPAAAERTTATLPADSSTATPTAERQTAESQAAEPPAEQKKTWENVALALFIGIPFLAILAAIPVAWGWGLGWRDVVIAFVMYAISGHGI